MVIYDISRLLSRIDTTTPTGIDRVDMRYFFHIYHRYHDAQFIYLSCGKFWVADRKLVYQVFKQLEQVWLDKKGNNSIRVSGSKLFYQLVTLRKKNISILPTQKQVSYLSQPLKNYIQQNNKVTYVNSSHTNLDKTAFFEELKTLGVTVAVVLYDLIPITHPQYCRVQQAGIHQQRMHTLVKYADVVLAISQATRQQFLTFVEEQNWQFDPSSVVVNYLGTEDLSQYIRPEVMPSTHKNKPYFLVIGTIEPRKNHLFLLRIWQQLVKEMGNDCPNLYVIGKRGWINAETIAMLERCPSIQPYVQELSDISDYQLASLMQNAKGLLMPSFVEGWGMPVAEALTLGTPVICNDIEVFNEVGQSVAQLVSVTDFAQWKTQIKQLIVKDTNRMLDAHYKAIGWQQHFDGLDKQIS